MTKTERINAMVNKNYSLIGRKAVENVVTGKITVDFIGEFEGKQVNMSFHCSNRIQVAVLLKRFRVDTNDLMTWVNLVVISNVNRGPVKNSQGQWKSRPRVLEFRAKRNEQPTPEEPQPEAPAPIAANVPEDTTEASVTTYTTASTTEPAAVNEKKVPARATKKIKINGQTIVIADEWVDHKWIRVNWYTREYFERNKGMRRNRKFEVSRQAMWNYIQRENAAKEPKMDIQLFSKDTKNNLTTPKARMTINQLEELIAKMKEAIEKKSCSSTVRISIDQQGTITFNQQSGYQECVGEFYTYRKNR